MKARVLIDASNLVVGGGIQVAASFIDNLFESGSEPPVWLGDCELWVSPDVAANLGASAHDPRVRLAARRWRLTSAARVRRDVVFTVFGPTYGPRVGRREVLGYADGTSVNPAVARSGVLSLPRRRLQRALSLHSVRSADTVIVETAAMQDRLVTAFGLEPSRIVVVPNTWHEAFDHRPSAQHVAAARAQLPDTGLLCLYVARAYPHKNHRVLAPAARAAASRGLPVRFIVTLKDEEWSRLPVEHREHLVNVGPKMVEELPSLYASCDAVIFPSLLETSSVTPLEALRSRKPLLASDRDFVRAVVGDAALYFEPTDPESVASALVELSRDPAGVDERLDRGDLLISTWPRGRSRALAYQRLIDEALGSLN